jgi:hypothetical protein
MKKLGIGGSTRIPLIPSTILGTENIITLLSIDMYRILEQRYHIDFHTDLCITAFTVFSLLSGKRNVLFPPDWGLLINVQK